jgi:predicted amidohydrolase YtcJ
MLLVALTAVIFNPISRKGASPMPSDADMLLTGGRIHTLHPAVPDSDALALKDGRIAAYGAAARALRGPGTEMVDLRGGLALPGFVDAHIHLLWYGLGLEQVVLTDVASYAEAERRIREALARTPPGAWVIGSGWNQERWNGLQPHRRLLDALSTRHPILLTRKDGHSIWVNSAALALAGITSATADPPGGRIERTAGGAPSGILAEEAMGLVRRRVPAPDDATRDRALAAAMANANRAGITAIHDMEGADARAAFQRALDTGRLSLRVQIMADLDSWRSGWRPEQRANGAHPLFQTGALKIFSDGALGSRTAAMLEPYNGTDHCGLALMTADELGTLITAAAEQNLGCAIHAIGDAANRLVLDAYAVTRGQWAPRGLRQRIEHVQLLHGDDLPRLAQLGVIASMQPIHATADLAMADTFWGDRSRLGYAWRSVLRSGATLAFGSDCPVETLDVLHGLYAAVTRRRADGSPPDGWYPEQRLTLPEALHAYTLGAAYAAGREAELGNLGPGKLADITVLDRDILSLPAESLLETAVRTTVVGGRIVFDAERT